MEKSQAIALGSIEIVGLGSLVGSQSLVGVEPQPQEQDIDTDKEQEKEKDITVMEQKQPIMAHKEPEAEAGGGDGLNILNGSQCSPNHVLSPSDLREMSLGGGGSLDTQGDAHGYIFKKEGFFESEGGEGTTATHNTNFRNTNNTHMISHGNGNDNGNSKSKIVAVPLLALLSADQSTHPAPAGSTRTRTKFASLSARDAKDVGHTANTTNTKNEIKRIGVGVGVGSLIQTQTRKTNNGIGMEQSQNGQGQNGQILDTSLPKKRSSWSRGDKQKQGNMKNTNTNANNNANANKNTNKNVHTSGTSGSQSARTSDELEAEMRSWKVRMPTLNLNNPLTPNLNLDHNLNMSKLDNSKDKSDTGSHHVPRPTRTGSFGGRGQGGREQSPNGKSRTNIAIGSRSKGGSMSARGGADMSMSTNTTNITKAATIKNKPAKPTQARPARSGRTKYTQPQRRLLHAVLEEEAKGEACAVDAIDIDTASEGQDGDIAAMSMVGCPDPRKPPPLSASLVTASQVSPSLRFGYIGYRSYRAMGGGDITLL